jgi:hypothetical protein
MLGMDGNLNVAAKVLRSWMEKILILSVGYHLDERPRFFSWQYAREAQGLLLFDCWSVVFQ